MERGRRGGTYRVATPQSSKAFNIGLRLVCNADDGIKGLVVTKEEFLPATPKKAGRKTLIVFFSWGGNTRGIAIEIQKQTGFDMVELELVKRNPILPTIMLF